ncbi:MAG: tripartite tricarboxylate transporter substrate-binding protein, partial [Desulfobacterales bacterium]|nr:tripartite tricarboxylate transporter substrate-binding protein [Desulfobacterales bacterium]
MVCFDPGSSPIEERDFISHTLDKILGQKVIIDYKVGGGGALGWRELIRAKPDDYTFAGFNIPQIILQPLQQDVGYQTEQIVPVMIFQRTPLGTAFSTPAPSRPFKSSSSTLRKTPVPCRSCRGSGSFSGCMATPPAKLTGAKLTYVPFTGSAPQMLAFL